MFRPIAIALFSSLIFASCLGVPIVILPPPAPENVTRNLDGRYVYEGQLPAEGANAVVLLFNETAGGLPYSAVASPTGCYVIPGVERAPMDLMELMYRRDVDGAMVFSDSTYFLADLSDVAGPDPTYMCE